MMARQLYCPQCGKASFERCNIKRFVCSECHFEFFFNAATTASAIIIEDGKLLVAVRGRDPEKGMLDLPGGFVDPGETLEQGVTREIKEELGLDLCDLRYFTSGPTLYQYANVDYHTCDTFFFARCEQYVGMRAGDDVAELRWLPIESVTKDMLAFGNGDIVVSAIRHYEG
ncbi:hypothetical protein A9Q99_05545 [Gammaproteobacteria bacterium 45_16_T64]|nr:hypothetical protein A9Q99_05545 [Gammaproteobacteria bacterium 45_16_T64]